MIVSCVFFLKWGKRKNSRKKKGFLKVEERKGNERENKRLIGEERKRYQNFWSRRSPCILRSEEREEIERVLCYAIIFEIFRFHVHVTRWDGFHRRPTPHKF